MMTQVCSTCGKLLNGLVSRCECYRTIQETVVFPGAQGSAGTGVKHDSDKPDMSLLSSIAFLEVAKVMTFGKKKYAAHNWRGGFAWSRPLAAAARHLFAYIGGEDKDPETGLSHLAHCICCCMFVLEFSVTGAGQDDRYKGNTDVKNS